MIEIKWVSMAVSQCRSRSPKRVIMLVHGHGKYQGHTKYTYTRSLGALQRTQYFCAWELLWFAEEFKGPGQVVAEIQVGSRITPQRPWLWPSHQCSASPLSARIRQYSSKTFILMGIWNLDGVIGGFQNPKGSIFLDSETPLEINFNFKALCSTTKKNN